MLLLYLISAAKTDARAHIYIPLCFYFIQEYIRLNGHVILIYIPLCFYFIILEVMKWKRNFLIYIPLCFDIVKISWHIYFKDITDYATSSKSS